MTASEAQHAMTDKEGKPAIPPALTKKDVAVLLGVSLHTVDRYLCQNLIPHFKLPCGGKRAPVRFDPAELEKWIRKRMVKVNPFAA